jgi:hypothetical protein
MDLRITVKHWRGSARIVSPKTTAASRTLAWMRPRTGRAVYSVCGVFKLKS